MKTEEIDKALKRTILAGILVPIGYLLTLLFPRVKTFLNDRILPTIEKATLSILLCIFVYLLLLALAYIYLLRKKIKELADEIYKLGNPPIKHDGINNSKFWPDLGVSQDLKTKYYICPKCSHFLRIDSDGLRCTKCDNFIPVNMSEALLKHIEFLKRFTNVPQ